MASVERKLPYFNPLQLITEVQRRPMLYKPEVPDYSDRSKKTKVWFDICEIMIPGWSKLPSADKNLFNREIQNRWRSIRDSFVKDYRKFKRFEETGEMPLKKRKYIYYDQLLFLVETMEKHKRPSSDFQYVEEETTATNKEDFETTQIEEVDVDPFPQTAPPKSHHTFEYVVASSEPSRESFETEVLGAIRQIRQPEADEDRMFLLSLLSSFKKMDDETKMNTRIEVLQCINKALKEMKRSKDNLNHVADLDVKPFT